MGGKRGQSPPSRKLYSILFYHGEMSTTYASGVPALTDVRYQPVGGKFRWRPHTKRTQELQSERSVRIVRIV